MNKTARTGTLSDQDRWRREGYRRMTPNERVQALLEFRCACFPAEMKRTERRATPRSHTPQQTPA